MRSTAPRTACESSTKQEQICRRNTDETPHETPAISPTDFAAKGGCVNPSKWLFTLPQLAASDVRTSQGCCDVTLPQKVALVRPFSRDQLRVSLCVSLCVDSALDVCHISRSICASFAPDLRSSSRAFVRRRVAPFGPDFAVAWSRVSGGFTHASGAWRALARVLSLRVSLSPWRQFVHARAHTPPHSSLATLR